MPDKQPAKRTRKAKGLANEGTREYSLTRTSIVTKVLARIADFDDELLVFRSISSRRRTGSGTVPPCCSTVPHGTVRQ